MKAKLFTLILGVVLLAAPRAEAAILYMGGEDVDVVVTGTLTTSTTAGQFRAGWARAGIGIASTGSANDPPTSRYQTPTFSSQSTAWVHFTGGATGTTATTLNSQGVRVYGSDGVVRLALRGTGTNGQIKISTRSTAGTFVDLVTCTAGVFPVATGSTPQIDFFINYAVSGQVTVYADSVQICNFTGDVTTDGVTAINQAEFANFSTSNSLVVSEILIQTTDTRGAGVRTLIPAAAGTSQAWLPNTVANVNPSALNDTNFVASLVNNDLSQWTVGTLPAGTWSVLGVKQSARVVAGTAGPLHFSFNQRVGGSDFNTGSVTPTTAFTNYYNYLSTSPNTGVAWVTSEFGAGVNFGLKALP